MKVIVCGGRDYKNKQLVYDTLDGVLKVHGCIALIHGAANGADALAHKWWSERAAGAVYPEPVTKDEWRMFGKAAGHNRNQRMIDKYKPDLVIAFPGGTGTADMLRRAREAGIDVWEVKDDGRDEKDS